MNDQMIMENILLTTKGACDLYMHGTIESATQNVQQAFDSRRWRRRAGIPASRPTSSRSAR